ncbi:MAG: VOC family protein [Micrococcales bacterium]|nr:VOC family protein [Micrococcales bacterium]MCL2667704.1 VOC family protein [Micrococcales bacterium]
MSDNDAPRLGVSGMYTTDGVPHSSTSITPFLAVEGAAQAVQLYASVFGARVVDVTEIGGVVVHAELDFGHGKLQLGEPTPSYGLVTGPGGDTACYSIGLYCADVDALVERAEQAGAVVREPATTFVSGDRYASVRDPFGVRWSIMSRVEDLSEADSARRVADWAAAQAAGDA